MKRRSESVETSRSHMVRRVPMAEMLTPNNPNVKKNEYKWERGGGGAYGRIIRGYEKG